MSCVCVSFNYCAIFVLLIVVSVTFSKDCKIPNQSDYGDCVIEDKCAVYTDLITRKNSTNERATFLYKLVCSDNNDENYICCPKGDSYKNPNIDIGPVTNRPQKYATRFEENECGVDVGSDRIFGGTITEIDEFPWLALLMYQPGPPDDLKHACGGVLIDPKFVLTAAHCVSSEAFKKVGPLGKVRLGEYNLDTTKDCIVIDGEADCSDPPIDYNPEKIIIHPNYNPKDWDKHNDIALIKLDKEAPYTDFIRPICLPSSGGKTLQKKNTKFTAAGWGRTDYFDKRLPRLSSIKLKVHLPPFDRAECQNIYKGFDITLADSQLCAGGVKGFDTCRGDSGSPLMYFSSNEKVWYVYGVTSSGTSACGSKGVPSIYTDVTKFLPWIQSVIRSY